MAANNRIQFYLFRLRLEGERTCSCHLSHLNTHIRGLPHVYNISIEHGSSRQKQALFPGNLQPKKGAKIKSLIFYLGDQQLIYQVARCQIDETTGRQSCTMSPQAREHNLGDRRRYLLYWCVIS